MSGRVTFADGKPAAGFRVRAFEKAIPFEKFMMNNPNSAVTDRNGRYKLTIATGWPTVMGGPDFPDVKGYTVIVDPANRPYIIPAGSDVDVAPLRNHAASGIDFVMNEAPTVNVSIVDAATGKPDAGIKVIAGVMASTDSYEGVTGADGKLRFIMHSTTFDVTVGLPETMYAAPGYGYSDHVSASPGDSVTWELKTVPR